MIAAPAMTMLELMAVAYSGLVYVTMATPAVWSAPTMPETNANTFLFIVVCFWGLIMRVCGLYIGESTQFILVSPYTLYW